MTNAPQFLSWPKGAAKYPFSASCSSPARPGTMMVTWEGSWTPSETRADRPNASETLTLTDYEPFIPGREAGTKIFMYWTARCTADPWLQGGTCHPYGSYVPDDLREAFPGIDGQSFPRTVNQMSSSLRQQLFVEYQRVNSQTSMSSRNRQNLQGMMRQSPLSQSMTTQPRQSQAMIVVPQATTPKPDTTMESAVARPRIFMRGVEPTEGQPSGQQAEDMQPSSGESQATAVPDEGADAIAESVALTLDRPLHVITAKGGAVVLEPGVYEISPIMDLHLGLAKEGQPTRLLQGTPDTHTAVISQPMALLIQEESDDLWHLMFLTPDGKRFDAVGSTSGVTSRGTGRAVALPDRKLNDAIISASAQPATGPPPPCLRSTLPVGPRWLPIPCTMPSMPGIPTTPVPYVDGSNMLHACLNNNTGLFRVVRPPDACVELHGEVKVRWQLAP